MPEAPAPHSPSPQQHECGTEVQGWAAVTAAKVVETWPKPLPHVCNPSLFLPQCPTPEDKIDRYHNLAVQCTRYARGNTDSWNPEMGLGQGGSGGPFALFNGNMSKTTVLSPYAQHAVLTRCVGIHMKPSHAHDLCFMATGCRSVACMHDHMLSFVSLHELTCPPTGSRYRGNPPLPAYSGFPPTRPLVQWGAQLVAVHGKQSGRQSASTTSWLGPAGQYHLGACRLFAGNDRRSSNCASRCPPPLFPLSPGPISLPIPHQAQCCAPLAVQSGVPTTAHTSRH